MPLSSSSRRRYVLLRQNGRWNELGPVGMSDIDRSPPGHDSKCLLRIPQAACVACGWRLMLCCCCAGGSGVQGAGGWSELAAAADAAGAEHHGEPAPRGRCGPSRSPRPGVCGAPAQPPELLTRGHGRCTLERLCTPAAAFVASMCMPLALNHRHYRGVALTNTLD